MIPVALATPTACPPDEPVRIVNRVHAQYPHSALYMGLGPITVLVRATISATGKITASSIERSSGNMAVDLSALQTIRKSTFQPKIENCNATEAVVVEPVNFDPNNP